MATNSQRYKYVLITPARNEAAFINKTLESVVAQDVLPVKWVIVSDASTDGTDEIVASYAKRHEWIELLKTPERQHRDFASKAYAVAKGYEHVRALEFELLGSVDGDVSFSADFFSFLVAQFERDPSLGMAGAAFTENNSTYDYRYVSLEHVSGQCQLFRRVCFEAIGGYVPSPSGGIDVMAVLAARMKGWQTRTFPQQTFVHHRAMGTASSGRLMAKFKDGRKDYLLGGHPLWELFRCTYQMRKAPLIVGGFMILAGYITTWLRGIDRPMPLSMVRYRRQDQLKRLKQILGNLVAYRQQGRVR